jgi:hypothetical protein
MNSLHLYLAIGVGVVGVIVMAVIWSLRRMPSEAELDELHRQQCAQAVRDSAAPDAAVVAQAGSASADR